MKLNKLFASIAASAVAASALAATASANLLLPTEDEAHPAAQVAGMYLVQIYNDGTANEVRKPATDYGVDVEAIDTVTVTFTVADDSKDWFEGACGGNVVTSCNGDALTDEEWALLNWPSNEWWGVVDEDLGIESYDPAKPCSVEKVADYTYKITCKLQNRFLAKGSTIQVGLQEWGDTMNNYIVTDLSCLDESGNVLISFDKNGYPTLPGESSATVDSSTSGSVDAATDSDKASPNTGVEDVAVVAGLAIVAGGAVLVSKKRK